ncbi:serine hydrolase domain-containing protein [Streptomyces beijiangensis]|uniref:Beta-lactamase family protein n=1 Tax=Streptomyces beijiangensis TaxID=163361 RepID=A0A939JK84_9ACTN|nr:serine hydrolase domain-containing protein [Streptomyces beijiangensis]MBO0515030.1 beta-lactamase family protein [Streptomyces beijiangensis]
MNTRTRSSLIAATLVLGLVAAPAVPAFAHSHAPAATAAAKKPLSKDDAKALADAIADPRDAGATAALLRVTDKDGSTWNGATGVHDLTSNRAADSEARFRAGSVTKVFTAAVVLQLASEHKVDLDRPIRAYLPELIPATYGTVTVRQLLNHTHGMASPDFPGTTVEEWYANRLHVFNPEAMVKSALTKDPEFAPGTQQHYTNIGYTLAGLLIQKVTGDTYEHQVARRIINPLHLRSTSFPGTDPRIHGPHNIGYQSFVRADGTTELRDVSVWSATDGWAAGDLISSTADLTRFVRALFSGQVVRGPLLKEMFTLPKLDVGTASYSVGLTSWKFGTQQVWGKTGGRWGYNAGIAATPDLSRIAVYSINSTDAKAADRTPLIPRIAAAAFPTPPVTPPAAPPVG